MSNEFELTATAKNLQTLCLSKTHQPHPVPTAITTMSITFFSLQMCKKIKNDKKKLGFLSFQSFYTIFMIIKYLNI